MLKLNSLKMKFMTSLMSREVPKFIVETACFLLENKSYVYYSTLKEIYTLLDCISYVSSELNLSTVIVSNASMVKYLDKFYDNFNFISTDLYDHGKNHDIIIFYEVTDSNVLGNIFKIHNLLLFSLTTSPINFNLNSTSLIQFTPVKYDGLFKNFLRELIGSSNLITYESYNEVFNNREDEFKTYINKLKKYDKEIFLELCKEGQLIKSIFESHAMKTPYTFFYESSKLKTLFKILGILKDGRNCVLIKDIKYLKSLCNKNTTKISTILHENKNIFVDVDILLHENLRSFNEDIYDNIIIFDFIHIRTSKMKYIFCSSKEKAKLKDLLNAEESIEQGLKYRISSEMKIFHQYKTSKERNKIMHKDSNNMQKEIIKARQFKIFLEGETSLVKNDLCDFAENITKAKNIIIMSIRTSFSLVTSYILSRYLNLPVTVPSSDAKSCFNLKCDMFVIGHINFYNSFIPAEEFNGKGCLFFNNREISYVCFTSNKNIRFDIDVYYMEKHGFIDFSKTGEVCLFLALKIAPKVYMIENLNEKIIDDIINMNGYKKFLAIDELEWERVTAYELGSLKEAYDLKFIIELRNNSGGMNSNSRISKTRYKSIFMDSNTANLINFISNKISEEVPGFNEIIDTIKNEQILIESLFNRFIKYKTSLAISSVKNNFRIGSSLCQIRAYCANIDFKSYYHLEILLTNKGRFINNKIRDLSIFDGDNINEFTKYLDRNLKNRFICIEFLLTQFKELKSAGQNDSILSKHQKNKVKENYNEIRHVSVMPFNIKCIQTQPLASNRVSRHFNSEFFIRVYFRDDDDMQLHNFSNREMSRVYDNIKRIMKNGILIGQRRYFFLAMSSSQLKLHSAWFVTPYIVDETLIGADYIRSWLGDFRPIHNIGKYAVRLGQALSCTTPTVDMVNIIEIDDITRNGYCFSDGVGKISLGLARVVSDYLNLLDIPSAFQIRMGGFKGVVSLYVNDYERDLIRSSKILSKTNGFCKEIKKVKKVEFTGNELCEDLVLRHSLKKFESNHRNLEIVTYSQHQPGHLNRQIIIILESLGIKKDIFIEMQDKSLSHIILTDPVITLKRHLSDFIVNTFNAGEQFFINMFVPILKRCFDDLITKAKIPVCKGRLLMGILDEYEVLNENEIFIMCSPCVDCYCEERKIQIITGDVAIAKNPCLHPGDVRVVKAVDRNELHHLKDVVVFSSKGDRPIFNMCSGSDLDGDCYFCTWDKRLIPDKVTAPDSYASEEMLYKEVVSLDDIVNFYIKFMQENHLGLIANSHLALSDCLPKGVSEPECIRLATIFNRGVDFPKSGYVPNLPADLEPEIFPDFMQHLPSYRSKKTLGIIFRRILILNDLKYYQCECQGRVSEHLKSIYSFGCYNLFKKFNDFFIFEGRKASNHTLQESVIVILSYENETKNIFHRYKQEMIACMKMYDFKSENDAILGFYKEDIKMKSNCYINDILRKYRNTFFRNTNPSDLFYKAVSWYKISHEQCGEEFLSFGWLSGDTLIRNQYEFDALRKDLRNEINVLSNQDKNHFNADKNSITRNIYNRNPTKNTLPKKNIPRNKIKKNKIPIDRGDKPVYNMSNVNDSDYSLQERLFHKGIRYVKFKLNDHVLFIDGYINFDGYNQNITVVEGFTLFMDAYEPYVRNDKNISDAISDLFHLFHALRFFRNAEIMIEFIVLLSAIEKKSSTKTDFCNALIALSHGNFDRLNHFLVYYNSQSDGSKENIRNQILLVAYIFALKQSLGLKLLTLETYYLSLSVHKPDKNIERKIFYYRKSLGLSILGMFDVRDYIYMEPYLGESWSGHPMNHKYIPSLLNPGSCSVENYKNELRIFLLHNSAFNKFKYNNVSVYVIPGNFYFLDVNENYRNNNFEIREIVSKTKNIDQRSYKIKDDIEINEVNELNTKWANIKNIDNDEVISKNGDLSGCFYMNHSIIKGCSNEYINMHGLKINTERSYFILSINFNQKKYYLYYENNQLYRISLNRKANGKYIIMNKSDVQFVAIKEELIFCKVNEIDLKPEKWLKGIKIEQIDNKTYKIIGDFNQEQSSKIKGNGENTGNLEIKNEKGIFRTIKNCEQTSASRITQKIQNPTVCTLKFIQEIGYKNQAHGSIIYVSTSRMHTANPTGGENCHVVFKNQEIKCYGNVENLFNVINFKTFDRFFECVWATYKDLFNK